MSKKHLRIATRKSPLALWQANHIRDKLLAHWGSLRIDLIPMVTSGDQFFKDQLSLLGGKGLFVKELEEALLDGRADFAVHSMKDVPAILPNGLFIGAVLPRDRWGALGLYPQQGAHYDYQKRGAVWSATVRLPAGGCQVVLNADHTRLTTVEIADEKFGLLPAYSGAKAGHTSVESGLDCAVAFPDGSLAALGGRTVRLKITLEKEGDADPRLFAVYLRAR